MIELLKFIFAIAILIVAFKLTMGCLKIVLWLGGTLLFIYAFMSLFI